MKLNKIVLSTLLFSVALVTGSVIVQSNVSASSSDTLSTPLTRDISSFNFSHDILNDSPGVWAQLPDAGSTSKVQLKNFSDYTLYNQIGDKLTDHILSDNPTDADCFTLLLTPNHNANFLVRVGEDDWLKIDSNVTLNIGTSGDKLTDNGGLTPTNFVVNFVDQNGQTVQSPIVLPISSVHSDGTSYMNADVANDMTAMRDDLTRVTYNIDGYTPRATDPVTTDGDYTTTFHYVKKSTPVTPSGTVTPAADTISSSSDSSSKNNQDPQNVQVKGLAVYATKAIGLYKTPNFSKMSRRYLYDKQSRTSRPQFVVTNYARSKKGTLRYKVRDVRNPQREGYITANSDYVTNTYYQTIPKAIKVLSRHGINAYGQVSLSGKHLKHYAQGTSLKVKAIKSYHLTNRFVLSNGHYISANKVLVIKK